MEGSERNMLIQLANNSDAPELKILNDIFNGKGCNTVEEIEESLQKNEQEIVCVAADGNKLVGFCCGQVLKSICYSYKYGEITELFVMEQYNEFNGDLTSAVVRLKEAVSVYVDLKHSFMFMLLREAMLPAIFTMAVFCTITIMRK
jgi:hypothetical protein